MSSDSEGLLAAVRRQLRDGVPPETVVEGLVARGLSRVTAERFVERAQADGGSPAAAPNKVDDVGAPPAAVWSRGPQAMTDMDPPDPDVMRKATYDLIRGGLLLAAGIAITVLSFETPRARLMVGLLIWGLWDFGRGVHRCTQLDGPFPLRRVLLAAAIPGVVVVALGVYVGSQAMRDPVREAAEAREAAWQARLEQAQQQAQQDAKARELARGAALAATPEGRIERAMWIVRMGKPDAQCEAALELARLKVRHQASTLFGLAWSNQPRNVQICGARALVILGELSRALAVYQAWAGGSDPHMRRAALAGFGEIGPEAELEAMPFLTEALKSPDAEIRNLASVALSKVRPAAAQGASTDQDQ